MTQRLALASARHLWRAVAAWIAAVVVSIGLLDATIIRSVILPATMKLTGKWNWYLPKKLGWLPDFHVEDAS